MTTWLPADVWRRVVERDASAAVAVLRVSRELHSVATSELRRLLPFDEVLALWRSSSTLCVQSQLCEALLLSPDAVAAHPHETRKRYGGGCYHVFDAREALPALVRASGGVRGLADRLGAHRSRLEAKRRRDEERPAAQADRAGRLGRGLAVLGLQRRADSEACSAYIRSGNDLERALRTAAHMHFLHEHTDGAYAAAVDDGVEEEARDRGFHYPGIYRETTLLVQRRPPFRLPAALPWLLDFACTATALDAALRAVDADEHRKRARRSDLLSRREAARSQRHAALVAALGDDDGHAGDVPAADQLRRRALFFGMESHPALRFWDVVVACKVGLAEACHLAKRLSLLHRTHDELARDAALLFRDAARFDWHGDVPEMAAVAAAAAEATRRARKEERARRRATAEAARARYECHGVGCRNLHARESPPTVDGFAVCRACATPRAKVEPR